MKILLYVLAIVPTLALSAPKLTITFSQSDPGLVYFDFKADESTPVSGFQARMVLPSKPKKVEISECASLVAKGNFGGCGYKAGVYTLLVYNNNNEAIGSTSIGAVYFPPSMLKAAKNGEIELVDVQFSSSEAYLVNGDIEITYE